jgi:hypothetical protein
MRAAPSVSGRHPKTFTTSDIGRRGAHVAFVPTATERSAATALYSITSSARPNARDFA